MVVVDDEVAKSMGLHPLDRVRISANGREVIAIVNIARKLPVDTVALYDEVAAALNVNDGDAVTLEPVEPPRSIEYIRDKLRGVNLRMEEVREIVRDIVRGALNDVEITALVTSLHHRGISREEAYYFTLAMVETGRRLRLNRYPVLDKHSLGGVPGDKTTLLVVPIIASLGYIIPKTSSRAITSPAGTADRFEVLAPVDLSIEEMSEVVLRTNGCIAWGGALGLAPADDIIIQVEYPLAIDPFYIPSIMAKKAAVGSTHVVIDIPTGRMAKVKTIDEAVYIAREFIELASRLGIKLECAITYGDEPIGYAVGPALEAREALMAIGGQGPQDLVDKAASIAGILLEMVGRDNGKELALEAIRSGRAEAKLREIVEAQGGDPGVRPDDVPVGEHGAAVEADRDGVVTWIDTRAIARIARLAGAPKDKGAGVLLKVKVGDRVKRGEPLFEIRAERAHKLEVALKHAMEARPVSVGRPHTQMLVGRVAASVIRKGGFELER